MTVDELRKELLYMDPDAEVFLRGGVHLMRKYAIARVERVEDEYTDFAWSVMFVAEEFPEHCWWMDPEYREEYDY